jgi:hypothetical protein
MKKSLLFAALLTLALGTTSGVLADDHPAIAKGSAGKGEAIVSHAPARRGDPNKTRYDFQLAITGREGNTFTAVLADTGGRGRAAIEAKLKGELSGNEIALEVVSVDKGAWFPYIPKKLTGKVENGKILLQWTRNDRQPLETKGAMEAILTVKK